VGVAISASLLPPVVNIGMQLAFALLGPRIHGGSPGSGVNVSPNALDNATVLSPGCALRVAMSQCAIGSFTTGTSGVLSGATIDSGKISIQLLQQRFKELAGNWQYSVDWSVALGTAAMSFALFMMNFVVIFVVTLGMFELKQITPAGKRQFGANIKKQIREKNNAMAKFKARQKNLRTRLRSVRSIVESPGKTAKTNQEAGHS
jgi:hypothetical protein